MQYPRKIYFIDNGFLKYLSLQPGESRILENMQRALSFMENCSALLRPA
jgi:predicted AAA+ superfamily ATPase